MLIVISPSKSQDFSDQEFNVKNIPKTEPELLEDSKVLINELKQKSPEDIARLMDLSENLATLNYSRYQNFSPPFTERNAKPALFAFQGDVYTDIEIDQYSEEDFEFAQDHLRIISGLYGLLKPLDLIQPYRLEMKIKLNTPDSNDLYEFWGDKITRLLNENLAAINAKALINLASNEYFKAIDQKKLQGKVITPEFKEFKQGQYKVVAVYAKRARGMMTNFIIKNKITDPEQIKTFNEAGYEYHENMSTDDKWVFIR